MKSRKNPVITHYTPWDKTLEETDENTNKIKRRDFVNHNPYHECDI